MLLADASNFVHGVDQTLLLIFCVALFFLVTITATMLFFVSRYKRERNPKSTHIEGSLWLEIIWTIVPVILVSIMFVYGWTNWKQMKSPPKNAFTIKSTARMWSWSFTYPNGKITDSLYVPVNKPIKIEVNSADVIHSLYIPEFRVKQDVVPGNYNFLWFIAEKPGTYDIFCAEYCGLRHSYMTSGVVVMPEDMFDKWYTDTSKVTPIAGTGPVKQIMQGQVLMKRNGCVACHSVDGTRIVGPSFKGIYGSNVAVLVNGNERQVAVDDSYILESIYEPNAKIVKGFSSGLMQPYKNILSKEDVKQIAEYIKSLK